MSEIEGRIQQFVEYAKRLKGDEKGEAQVFCDRMFQAFGHEGYKEAGATLEFRVKTKDRRTKFADLFWRPRVLLEMKKRGEKLQRHYTQAFEYWLHLVPERPKYVVLCNFDEFWVYDFDAQLDDPMDKVSLENLPERYTVFNFLFAIPKKPLFGNDRVAVTRAAADKVATAYNAIVARGENREQAQRFILQCVVAMFSEDAGLLPRGLFTELIGDCRSGASSYDLLGSLFRQMNSPKPARGGRFKNIRYFNGGIFQVIDPVDLTIEEINLLAEASAENWSKVQPHIFGTLFQTSMGKEERHAYGAHFTSEADIQKVVLATIARPWREKVEAANTLKDLRKLLNDLMLFRVLDPACGSGNFVYVAYREMKRIELDIIAKIHASFGHRARKAIGTRSLLSTKQFFGIDVIPFAVELAKVTLMLAKELFLTESHLWFDQSQIELPINFDLALPLDNLDDNIFCDDALFCEWQKADAIISNPPYQSKNKMQQEFGRAYVNRVRSRYPDVPGRADYCVYWFRRAHDELAEGCRAGLVGTNTIRQNYSRQGGLDYIVREGGTITEAVSSQAWSGDAAVHVSIVNWIKGKQSGKKNLFEQVGDKDAPWEMVEVDDIGPALSPGFDVTQARCLRTSADSATCYQGQTHGHEGFLLTPEEAIAFIKTSHINKQVIFPYLTADNLFASKPPLPQRYVIGFHPRDIFESGRYKQPFQRIKELVLPTREEAAKEEQQRNKEALADNPRAKINNHHRNFLSKWWLLSYPRPELIEKVTRMTRYIVCGRVTKRPIFEFIHSGIRPNDALIIFTFTDDYSFGILQSNIHWAWFVARCSTLTERFRYTSDTVFNSFPWPQSSTARQVKHVAEAAVSLREARRKVMAANNLSLRELYRTLELPGQNSMKDAHAALDGAVREAYGMKPKDDPLAFLFHLNKEFAKREEAMKPVVGPGLPSVVDDPASLTTTDCIRMS
tara:strand:- start:528 stop:3404 length:2877 start_codon:yes stop_codon:yes gene_type:complete